MNILEIFEEAGLFSFIDTEEIKAEPSPFNDDNEEHLAYRKKQHAALQIELLIYNGGLRINGDRLYIGWDQSLGHTYIVDGNHMVTIERIPNLPKIKTTSEFRKYQIVVKDKELYYSELLEERGK